MQTLLKNSAISGVTQGHSPPGLSSQTCKGTLAKELIPNLQTDAPLSKAVGKKQKVEDSEHQHKQPPPTVTTKQHQPLLSLKCTNNSNKCNQQQQSTTKIHQQ